MKFSIIIPAYNAEGHIRRALDSIKCQTFKDYELIVVCDSCTDGTEEIAKEYGAITEAVNFHRDGLTRNRGIDMAQGEWILFMDDDDWWLHENVLQIINDRLGDFDILRFAFNWQGIGIRHGSVAIAVWCKCWRRDFIGNTRFSDMENWSDVGFNEAMMQKNPFIKDIGDVLYYYNYMRKGSISWRASRST